MKCDDTKDMFEPDPAPLVREAITDLYYDHVKHPNHDTAFYFGERSARIIREARLDRKDRQLLRIYAKNLKQKIDWAHEARAQQWRNEDA